MNAGDSFPPSPLQRRGVGGEVAGREPFLGWPGWRLLTEAIVLGTLQTAWWFLLYGGADWITAQRTLRVPIHFDAELAIPFVPAFILIYRSIDPMFLIGPFILRTRAEVRGLVLTLAVVTTMAAGCFLLIPAEVAYPADPDVGVWAPLFAWNRRVVLTYNMLPSLHVAFSVVTLAAYGRRCGPLGKTLLACWASAIAGSTLLIHAHHLADVATGFLLGWVGHVLIYRRFL